MANIVITGSNSGFGRLTAELLAKAGHTVYATMREHHKERQGGHRVEGFQCGERPRPRGRLDVTSDASVQRAIDTIASNRRSMSCITTPDGSPAGCRKRTPWRKSKLCSK
jgi:NAD(P)-dependent dehydrogenase (short-subunit alcohol dehydrogenase family)